MMKAQEQERIRIAGELHDGVMQEMLAVTMMLGTAKRRHRRTSQTRQATIDKIAAEADSGRHRHPSAVARPASAGAAGGRAAEAVRAYCEQFSAASGIPVACDADDDVSDLSRGAGLALFRIVQEALGNAAKHAPARQITVGLTASPDGLVSLTVSDDGVGLRPEPARGSAGWGWS